MITTRALILLGFRQTFLLCSAFTIRAILGDGYTQAVQAICHCYKAIKKDRFENKASATAPASNNRLSEFLRTFPTVIELSTVRLKTGSIVKSRPYFE